MQAYVFPGQGAQFPGMGKDLYDNNAQAHDLFEKANEILGFRITDIMFEGTEEDLRQTKVTQPAVFLHSVISAIVNADGQPDMTAGHSLGEYSALVAAGALDFEDGLRLVAIRANAMQRACEVQPSTMAAVVGLPDEEVEAICQKAEHLVVPANYNCPGQVVISGSVEGVGEAAEMVPTRGAELQLKRVRAIQLAVGGAFHSPLMQPAAEELREGIMKTQFHTPHCPIYQNVNAQPMTDPEQIRQNLVAQLTAPVRWTQSVQAMIANGATCFREFGPGDVLKGLIKKINKEVETL